MSTPNSPREDRPVLDVMNAVRAYPKELLQEAQRNQARHVNRFDMKKLLESKEVDYADLD